jgi:hypothetical protein
MEEERMSFFERRQLRMAKEQTSLFRAPFSRGARLARDNVRRLRDLALMTLSMLFLAWLTVSAHAVAGAAAFEPICPPSLQVAASS